MEERDTLQAMQLEALRKDISQGLESLDNGKGRQLDVNQIKTRGRKNMADSEVNADHFLDLLKDKASNLAEFNSIGTDRPELSANLKSFPVERYVLYYRINSEGIELVRVLHGSRDTSLLF